MGFSINQNVIHIKLTDKGRELLSRGQLTFAKFSVGDSEIDYSFYKNFNVDPSTALILRPADNNPDIASFITKEVGGENLIDLPSVVSNPSVITNTAQPRGLFAISGNSKQLYSDPSHVKQPHIAISISGVTGGKVLNLKQSSAYGTNPIEPVIGDYILVRWANPEMSSDTVGFQVNTPIPYLWYKIQNIISGTLSMNNLVVEVDRELPNFSGYTGSLKAGALVYPNNNCRLISGDSIQNYYGAPFITDFVSESMIAFIENYDTPTIEVPVWNMSIIFTEQIAGIATTGRSIGQYYSAPLGGIVRYVEKLDTTIKNIGVIHYTNNSPSNNYGEGLVASNTTVPTLHLPTIMWHKNVDGEIGIKLTADFLSQNIMPELNTVYYNLVDQHGNIVGKVFTDLKLFIIEDQELLFAMSYKSNRNWTLPPVNVGFNISLCNGSDLELGNIEVE